jgi:hypothetical protein
VSYFLAPSLVALRNEVDRRHPARDKSSDGWIGDPSHAARVSDHNPDESGMVHAIDVDTSGIDVPAFLKATIGDPRTWYVIHNGTIWSRTYGFKARAYTGSNPHTGHAHVSIRYSQEAETAGGSWYRGVRKTKGTPTLDLSNVAGQIKRTRDGKRPRTELAGVRLVQRALNDRLRLEHGRRIDVDGYAGPRTLAALDVYEKRLKRLGVGSPGNLETNLRRLGRGRYKVRK